MKARSLETEFRPRAVKYSGGSLLLLKPADAIDLINRAADEGVPILGVDGFLLNERGTQSPLEHLADYSDAVGEGHGCWQNAEQFVRERADNGLLFEVVLGSDPIEAV